MLSNLRMSLVNGAVILWGTRLSGFLFYRVMTLGEDNRLNDFFRAPEEPYLDRNRSFFPLKLASFWTIQAAWGFTCMLPITLLNSMPAAALGPLSVVSAVGLGAGLLLEAVADWQKYRFKQEHKDRWCDIGLWALSRHPNCKFIC